MRHLLTLILLACVFAYGDREPMASDDYPYHVYLPIVNGHSTLNVWTASTAAKIQPTTGAGTPQAIVNAP